jgi:hypothetical protein
VIFCGEKASKIPCPGKTSYKNGSFERLLPKTAMYSQKAGDIGSGQEENI